MRLTHTYTHKHAYSNPYGKKTLKTRFIEYHEAFKTNTAWKCPRSFSGPYSVRMRGNTDQKNSENGQFSRSATPFYFLKKNLTTYHFTSLQLPDLLPKQRDDQTVSRRIRADYPLLLHWSSPRCGCCYGNSAQWWYHCLVWNPKSKTEERYYLPQDAPLQNFNI